MKKLYQKKEGASRTLTSDAYLKHPKVKTNLESKQIQLLLGVQNQCIPKLTECDTVGNSLSLRWVFTCSADFLSSEQNSSCLSTCYENAALPLIQKE